MPGPIMDILKIKLEWSLQSKLQDIEPQTGILTEHKLHLVGISMALKDLVLGAEVHKCHQMWVGAGKQGTLEKEWVRRKHRPGSSVQVKWERGKPLTF